MNLFKTINHAYNNPLIESDTFEFESAVDETIDMLTERVQVEYAYKENLYQTIFEATGDAGIIHESVHSAIDSFIAWVKKVIQYIKDQCKKFFNKLITWVGDNQYIRNNADLLTNISGFEAKGIYKYTIPKEFPDNPLIKIGDSIDKVANAVVENSVCNTRAAAKVLIEEYKRGGMEITEEMVDTLRATLIKGKTKVTESEYLELLHARFRDGQKEPGNMVITEEYMKKVQRIYQSRNSYEEVMKSIQDQIKATEAQYNRICESITRIRVQIHDLGEMYEGDDTENLFVVATAYINKVMSLVNKMNNSIMLYFSAELDAVREMAITHQKIAARVIAAQKKEVQL